MDFKIKSDLAEFAQIYLIILLYIFWSTLEFALVQKVRYKLFKYLSNMLGKSIDCRLYIAREFLTSTKQLESKNNKTENKTKTQYLVKNTFRTKKRGKKIPDKIISAKNN